ncbi:ImmA/IrrE family metallo-endopeptidase [Paenibacillus solisilvae]|uniref:ImmA/IrrE family metallo-endopeptidase n=1 Tax=Paenibacillus solisilvae TaxID=2486751 RepID=A0ABW0VP30_9BACL
MMTRTRTESTGSAIIRPEFKRAINTANQILQELGNPEAPICPYFIANKYGWKIRHEQLMGPDGLTAKDIRNGKTKFVIFVASDINQLYSEGTLKRRQRHTIAHEIGHILLHSEYDWFDLEPEIDQKLEVEAHWFAAQILMPDYVFKSIRDLDPETLSDKCDVNYTSAKKRIEKIDDKIANRLIQDASTFFTRGPAG